MVLKKIALLFGLLSFVLLVNFAGANWMFLDSKGNEIDDGDFVSGNKIELKLIEEETPYFLYSLVSGLSLNDLAKYTKLCGPCKESRNYSKKRRKVHCFTKTFWNTRTWTSRTSKNASGGPSLFLS